MIKNPPIKVLHVRDTTEIGGPGKTIIETIEHIDSSIFDLHIAIFKQFGDKEISPFFREALKRGCKVHVIRSKSQYDPKIVKNLLILIKKNNFDIIHAHDVLSNFVVYLSSIFNRVPIITTQHGWINIKSIDKFKIYLDKWITKRFDINIVVSDKMKEQLLVEGYPQKKLKVLHNGIVIKNYKQKISTGHLDKLLNQKLKRPIIGTVGRLSKEKGHADFIKGVAIAIKKGINASFLIVGDGPERKNLEHLIRKYKLTSKIFLTGYLQNINKVYQEIA